MPAQDGPATAKTLPLRQRIWFRRGLALFLVLLLYLVIIWAVPKTIDDRRLRDQTIEWARWAIRNTTDVSIRQLDVDLGFTGTLRLDYLDARVEPSNIEFERPLFSAERIRIALPAWGVTGVPVEPTLEVTGADLRLERDAFGAANTDGLWQYREPDGALPRFPLRWIHAGTIPGRLRQSRLILGFHSPEETLEIPLDGELHLDPGAGALRLALDPGTFLFTGSPDPAAGSTGRIHLRRLDLTVPGPPAVPPVRLDGVHLLTEDFPVPLLQRVFPSLPPFPPGSTFSGAADYAEAEEQTIRLSGTLRGVRIPLFDIEGDLALNAVSRSAASSAIGPSLLLESRTPTGEAVRLTAVGRSDGSWSSLLAFTASLNLNSATPTRRSGPIADWLEATFATFPDLEVRADRVRVRKLDLHSARMFIEPSGPGSVRARLHATFAGGFFTAEAPSWNLRRERNPAEYAISLSNADAAAVMRSLAPELPPSARLRPSSGLLSLQMLHAEQEAADTATRSVRAIFTDTAFSLADKDDPVQELVLIREGLEALKELRRKAIGAERKPPAETPPLPRSVSFSLLTADYEEFPDGTGRVRLIGESPELGEIRGGGRFQSDGTYRVALSIRETPPAFIDSLLPGLPSDLAEAVREQALSGDGLRIDLTRDENGIAFDRRYVKDIFRRWIEARFRRD